MITLKHRGVEDCWFIYRGTDCIGSCAGGSIHLYRENHSPAGLRAIAAAVEGREIIPDDDNTIDPERFM